MELIKSINIPSMSVTQAVEKLELIYCNAIRNEMPLRYLPTPFFWGPAGIGKSEGVRELAQRIEKKTGKRVYVTDVRLVLYSPVDLRGVPYADEKREYTNWLMPKIFAMDPSEHCVNILFLDELSAAPQSVQAAAYQICLDRKIGEFQFPENCIVIAAGNRTTDQSIAYKMPKALCNRLMHFSIQSDYESWRAWATGHGIHEKIIGFLAAQTSRLCMEPETSDLAYPTPRSWTFVSRILENTGGEVRDAHECIAACIGNDIALEFETWCRSYDSLPPIADILQGRCRTLPKTHDRMHALLTSLIATLRDAGEDLQTVHLENACSYAMLFPKDFVAIFLKDLRALPNMNQKLMKCRLFQQLLGGH